MNKRYLIIIFSVVICLIMASMSFGAVSWYNTSYNLRKEINFMNKTRFNEVNIINLTTICGSNCQIDKDDVLMTYNNGTDQSILNFEVLDSLYSQHPGTNKTFAHFIMPDTTGSVLIYYNSTSEKQWNSSVFFYYNSFETLTGSSETWAPQFEDCNSVRLFSITQDQAFTGKNGFKKTSGSNSAFSIAIAPGSEFYVELMIMNQSGKSVVPNNDAGVGFKAKSGGTCDTETYLDNGVGIEYLNSAGTFRQYGDNTNDANCWKNNGVIGNSDVFHSMLIHSHDNYTETWFSGVLLDNETVNHLNPATVGKFGIQSIQSPNWDISDMWIMDDLRASHNIFRSYHTVNPQSIGGEESLVSEIIIQEIILYNKTREKYGSTMNQFSDLFYIAVNTTIDGLPAENAQCNYTTSNLSHVFLHEGGNFTLDNSNSIELITQHVLNNGVHDLIRFEVCVESGTAKDIEYYVNDNITAFNIIPSESIPLCTSGFHNEINRTKEFLGLEEINISIRCNTCVGTHKMRIRDLNNNNVNLVLQRRRGILTDNLIYNASSKLFEDFEHLHNFFVSSNVMNNSINISCNTTDSVLYIDVNPRFPVSIMNEIKVDDVIYSYKTNNTITQSGINYTILGSCNGLDIAFKQLNISYNGNGTLIKSVNDNFITLINNELDVEELYKTKLYCENTEGNFSVKVLTFWANDTIDPTIIWTVPNNANTTSFVFNTTNLLNIQFHDVNLFAFECNITNPNSVIQYSFNQTNINTTTYILNENIKPTIIGTWELNCLVTDDHTKKKIKDIPFNINNDDRSIMFDYVGIASNRHITHDNITIFYTGTYDIDRTIVYKDIDRYKFGHEFYLMGDQWKKEIKHKYKVKCNNIIYRENSDYIAHFICPDQRAWIDFQSDNVIRYEIDIDDDSATINMWTKPNAIIIFESLGGLNEIEETVKFEVTPVSITGFINPNITNYNFSTTSNVILFLVFVFFYISLMALAITFKNVILWSFAFFIGLFLGIMLVSLSAWLALVMFLFSSSLYFAVHSK